MPALAEGHQRALHLVPVVDLVFRINQAREGNVMFSEVSPCNLRCVLHQREDLRACDTELLVLLRQPAEMPAAEGSRETPQEGHDDAGLVLVVAKGKRPAVCRG